MGWKHNATGVEPAAGFTVVPAGEYTLRIDETEERTSSNGDPQVKVIFKVEDDAFDGAKIWHYVTFFPKGAKAAGIPLYFLKCIGEPYKGEFEVEPLNWIGRTVRATVAVEKDLKDRDRNVVKNFILSLNDTPKVGNPVEGETGGFGEYAKMKEDEVPF
jgi:hypothetical protein